MTIRFSVFIAASLDGFIARKDGSLDWLPGSDGAQEGEDFGYAEFFDSVDTLVVGRNTYEHVSNFPDWPYRGKRVIVLSSRYAHAPERIASNAEGSSAPPAELACMLESAGAKHVYVDGGKTIQAFLRAGLIDDMVITRVPILLGEGIPLFGILDREVRLRHEKTSTFATGLVQSCYTVIGSG